MPEFVQVVAVAIVAFIFLLLAFNSSFDFSGISDSGNTRYAPDRTVEFNNFQVYYTASEDRTGHLEGEVSAGVFSSVDKRVGFQVANPNLASEAVIVLNTIDTNYYGKIIVLVNGKQVYADNAPIGEVAINFDRSLLSENNVVQVVAESSGWRIWAPTVYRFSMDVVINYYGRKSVDYIFNITDAEISRLQRARINVFGSRDGAGNLNINMNGVRIFSGVTTVYKDFATSILREGNNTIDFSTEPNTKYDITSAQVILFFD
jgi:hypothetical protein